MNKWEAKKYKIPHICINLSRVTLMEYDIVNKISLICDKYNISHDKIIIEVTESISKMNDMFLFEVINKFRKENFNISLDDFGSDYSNLSILTKIDFDNVKIDKSIVDSINKNPKLRIIINHIINMCKELKNTKTIAEGVETKEQYDILKNYGCDSVQGYYFSKPITTKEFENKYLK